ncbi:hypothetical protein [uncultured Arthrobacter sp.]|uniref:hypothetical protein n=1 Tax=uncultured Arthrobacter sp. TaxID=114050 RepID=UPI0028D0454C|nr:hypothetical protein [uncultured Arthrobacter sp.]
MTLSPGLAAEGLTEYGGGKQGGSWNGEGEQPAAAIITIALAEATAANPRHRG